MENIQIKITGLIAVIAISIVAYSNQNLVHLPLQPQEPANTNTQEQSTIDTYIPPVDTYVPPPIDTYIPPVDTYVPPPIDTYIPPIDTYVPPPIDTYIPPPDSSISSP